MKKALVAIVVMIMSICVVQAAPLPSGWYKVEVLQVGVAGGATVSMLLGDCTTSQAYNLPSAVWANVSLESTGGKSMLAVFLTALATEKPAMVLLEPVSDGVSTVTSVTVEK